MQTINRPDPQQISWREWTRTTGSIVSWAREPVQIHHPAGRTAVHDGVAIGHWFILPLTADQHKLIDQGEAGLAQLKDLYYVAHGSEQFDEVEEMSLHEFEKHLFDKLCLRLKPPFDNDVTEAIQSWRR